MTRVKAVSKILHYISKILALGYLITILYSIICLLTNWGIQYYGEGKYLHILYMFTDTPFLNIDNNPSYIIFSFLLPLSLYTLFFWLAANVFKVFYQPKLFSSQNIVHLRRFYLFNIIAPGVSAAFSSIFVPLESIIWALITLHLFLGIFAYFLAAIFKQGLQLQNEQELFI
ncbi:hypothetical protein [Chitinophaga sp. RAB17]|uniref:hypothetical protein n=1 Tax=Chitinophaga sp. RAB17 TaxID=3233049 RepID=UPI003F8FECF4